MFKYNNDMKKIKPIFIIVCGGSGSGKTTIAHSIKNNIPKGYTCNIISMDNFYLPPEKVLGGNYDVPDAIDWFKVREIIKNLIDDRVNVTIPIYNFKNRSVEKEIELQPSDIVILEGIFALTNPDVYNLADMKIFVDVPDDERLIRRLLRDKKERNTNIQKTIQLWRNNVIPNHFKYIEPTKLYSDLVIPYGFREQENLVPIKAISGALEYMVFTANKRKRELTEEEYKKIGKNIVKK